jgi:hypothetical protein
MTQVPNRFWLELGLAASSAVLLLLTLVWRDWIELVLRVDPDRGSGSFEWAIVGVSIVATATFSVLARLDWVKAQEATR